MKIDYELFYYYESLKVRPNNRQTKKHYTEKTYRRPDQTVRDYIRQQAIEDGRPFVKEPGGERESN
jgi:hypothetical protein